MVATKPQMAILILVSGVFLAGFFLIYPGNYVSSLFRSPDPAPSVSYEGLKSQYQVGDILAFSLGLEGYWDEDVRLPETRIMKIVDANGRVTNQTVWVGKGIMRTPDEYANNPEIIIKAIYIEGTSQEPIILTDAGIYTVTTQGDDIKRIEAQFAVANG